MIFCLGTKYHPSFDIATEPFLMLLLLPFVAMVVVVVVGLRAFAGGMIDAL